MRIITRLIAGMPTMRLLAPVAMLILPSIAFADPAGVRVQNAWPRAMSADGTGVIYMTIVDTGPADTLTGVSSAVAAGAERHKSVDDRGPMKMRSVGALSAAPGTPVTLTFAHAGRITTMAGVQTLAAAMPAMDHRSRCDEMPVNGLGSQ